MKFQLDINLRKNTPVSFEPWTSVSVVSLHIRSMWETICEALASWSGWKFGSKIPVYPILGFGHQPSPPAEN